MEDFYEFKLPDPPGRKKRTIMTMPEYPGFIGDHSLVDELNFLIDGNGGRLHVPPSSWTKPVDWRGVGGVLLALQILDGRFFPGEDWFHLLPSDIQEATTPPVEPDYVQNNNYGVVF